MKTKYLLLAIFFLGSVLRFWQLGLNPVSLDWDEASLGYNAYSILRTGRDEYGTFLPLSIRSFGDFKPPLYTYLTIPAVAALGLNEFSVRFISALLGSLTVLLTYYLAYEIMSRKSQRFALLAAFLLAISPWHIQFSRVAFESNLSIFFIVLGVYFLLIGMRRPWYWVIAMLPLGISLYAYHSPRLFVPLLLGGMAVLYRTILWRQKQWVIIAGIVLGILAAPILLEMASTSARFGSVSVINPAERLGNSIARIEIDTAKGDRAGVLLHNRRIVYARDILAGYLDHWNIDFLFLTGDAPGRHHAVSMGMLYWWDLLLVPIGMVFFFTRRTHAALLVFWWYLIAPAASAFTSGTPHAVRALLFLPAYQLFSAAGVIQGILLVNSIRSRYIKWTTFLFSFSIFLFAFYYYLSMYWIHTPIEDAKEWQYGYKQAVAVAKGVEDQYDKIVMTYRYDQPHVFVLFYNQVDPTWYQSQWPGGEIERFNRNFGKYEFRNIEWEKEKDKTRTLFIGTDYEIPAGTTGLVTDILFPDGTTAFRVVGNR